METCLKQQSGPCQPIQKIPYFVYSLLMEEHPQARTIVETLARAGFVAYYAGGWVRDLLLGHPSDDIDIATNASPEIIQALFPKTVPIGIAFGIVLVIIEDRQYEVATFRNDIDYRDGRRPTRIEFTTAEEDAKRRDFTINGMFYDPLKDRLLDFIGGKEDLAKKIIRAIGNPHQRIKEDRLRMIRAIRLACRLQFTIDPLTEAAIRDHAEELCPAVAIERIMQELDKGLRFNNLQTMLTFLHEFGLLGAIFPILKQVPIDELKQRLAPVSHFPHKTPLIAFLLELFPNFELAEQLDLCKSTKQSKADLQFVTFLFKAKELIAVEQKNQRQIELLEWAHFYAHPFSDLSLQIIAAHFDEADRKEFLAHHDKRRSLLESSIKRISCNTPLIQSADLLAVGVLPGKSMGILLKEAERIAINEQLEEKEPVLERLKKHPAWPKI